ncbi:MAG TPA: putative porin, partial [Candidatus Paceibacterota bacterium]|nr:putative porin [Candidatus Paceibacterota bacterium]
MRNLSGKSRGARLNCLATTLLVTAAGLGAARAASDPALDQYIDLFIKKGFVTQEEVEKVKAESESLRSKSETASASGSKWKISAPIKNVELFGDVRLRFEDRGAEDQFGGRLDLQRMRYAVRLGLRGQAYDDFYYGLRLDTSANPRSSWVTLGSSTGGTPYQGPFGKSTGGIGVGQVYLGWKPTSWLEITAGKMAQPLYTTSMIWDGDVTPEGLAEHFTWTVGEADLFANFGQFLYQDTNPTKSDAGFFNFTHRNANLPFMLAWQAGFNYHLTKDLSFKVAPVLYNYTGHGANTTSGSTYTPDFAGIFVGQGSTNGVSGGTAGYSGYPGGNYDGFFANQTGINDLLVLEVPFELNYKMDRLNVR